MGSGYFALPSLKALQANNYNIVSIYSTSTKINPVENFSSNYNIPLFLPNILTNTEVLSQFKNLHPDIVVVASYGKIIPNNYLHLSKLGFINMHPSSLPKWRGAAPIQRTIMAGENKTSVSIIQVSNKLDSGNIILKEDIEFDNQTTGRELLSYTANIGAKLLIKVLQQYKNNQIKTQPQSKFGITYATKISSSERRINFSLHVKQVHNLIRALSLDTSAYFIHNNNIIKIIKSDFQLKTHAFDCGMIISNKMEIACKDGILKPILVQREGKKILQTEDFLRGYAVSLNTLLQ